MGRLNSLKGVRLELVRVYTEVRQGALSSQEGTRLTYILQIIARVLEQSDLEQRVQHLEEELENERTIDV